jgi:hypothetical protein
MLWCAVELAWGLLYMIPSRGDELHKKVQKISPDDLANHQSRPTQIGPPQHLNVLSPARLKKLKKAPLRRGFFIFSASR